MKNIKYFTLIILMGFSGNASGSAEEKADQINRISCPEVHLDAPGGPLDLGPTKAQQEGTCYAEAGNLLMAGYLKKSGKPYALGSTLLRAGQFEEKNRQDAGKPYSAKSFLNTGSSSHDYINHARSFPSCDEKKVCESTLLSPEAKSFICQMGSTDSKQACESKDELKDQKLFNKSLQSSVYGALYGKDQNRECLKNILKEKVSSCPKGQVLDVPPPKLERVESASGLMQTISKNLLAGGAVNLGIDSKVLLQKGHQAQFEKDQSGKRANFKGEGGHEVTASGMYFDEKTNQCMIEIKNWWGPSCNAYPWKCSKGKLSVPISELGKNTVTATHF